MWRSAVFALPTALAGALCRELVSEHLVVDFGYAEQVRDHEHRERAGELADEFAAAVGDELVDLLIGEPPHEGFVLVRAASA